MLRYKNTEDQYLISSEDIKSLREMVFIFHSS